MSDQDDKNCHPCHDHGEDPGVRNRYYRHKAMTAEDFRKEQDYMIERRRLINRAVIGWGVVNGLIVKTNKDEITVSAGVGLDQSGREVVVVAEKKLTNYNTFLLRSDMSCSRLEIISGDLDLTASYILRVHYAERDWGEAYLPSNQCYASAEHRYVRETVIFSLERVDSYATGDQENWNELGNCGDCMCDQECTDNHLNRRACLATLTKDGFTTPGSLLKIDGYSIPENGDGLTLGVLTGRKINTCGELSATVKCQNLRRIVKNNGLLYELQCGRDLTKIVGIDWDCFHFKDKCYTEMKVFLEKLKNCGLNITLSKNINPSLLSKNFIAVTLQGTWYNVDEDQNYSYSFIPLDPEVTDKTITFKFDFDPNELATKIRAVNKDSAVVNNYSVTTITIKIFGDLIIDCNGQAIDANNRGLESPATYPTGNGTPGGTFRSVVRFTNQRQADVK